MKAGATRDLRVAALTWAFHLPIKGASKSVLIALADHVDPRTGKCSPPLARIALWSGFSDRAVRKAICQLEAVGLIVVAARVAGSSTDYILNREATR